MAGKPLDITDRAIATAAKMSKEKKTRKRKLSLNDLTSEDLEKLLQMTLARLQFFSEEKGIIVKESSSSIEYSVKYLILQLRFFISRTTLREFMLKEPSKRLIISTSNISILKIFDDLVRDITSNKK